MSSDGHSVIIVAQTKRQEVYLSHLSLLSRVRSTVAQVAPTVSNLFISSAAPYHMIAADTIDLLSITQG